MRHNHICLDTEIIHNQRERESNLYMRQISWISTPTRSITASLFPDIGRAPQSPLGQQQQRWQRRRSLLPLSRLRLPHALLRPVLLLRRRRFSGADGAVCAGAFLRPLHAGRAGTDARVLVVFPARGDVGNRGRQQRLRRVRRPRPRLRRRRRRRRGRQPQLQRPRRLQPRPQQDADQGLLNQGGGSVWADIQVKKTCCNAACLVGSLFGSVLGEPPLSPSHSSVHHIPALQSGLSHSPLPQMLMLMLACTSV